MMYAAWRSLLARKLRLVMSAFAIVLGVAFVAGSLIFTDTLSRSFTSVMSGTVGDVIVRPTGSAGDETQTSRTVPASLVSSLAAVDGAARADGNVTSFGVFVVGTDGKVVGAQGAPGLGVSYHDAPAGHGLPGLTLTQGRMPFTAGEIALDARTAERAGYGLGDTVPLVTSGAEPTLKARLVGLASFGGDGGLAGASLTVFDDATAKALFQQGKDVYSDVWVTAADGVTQAELRDRVAARLPSGLEAVTGDKAADEASTDLLQAVSFISTFLLVFAAVALVVGSFLIVNTFSILVAQRSRELALLRALGASRSQVSRSVLFEAAVVGLVGSTLGLGLGFGLALGIKALFATLGLDLAGTALVFTPRTAATAYAVGMVVTSVAVYLPARRASRIAPVEAMRDDAATGTSSMRRRVAVGMTMAVVGAVGVGVGLSGALDGATMQVLGLGVLLVVLGVALASPLLGRPVIALVGMAYRRVFGTVGLLAEQNARRNPRRTAATASALMIGLTMVSMMAVFGQSAKASVDKVIARSFAGDYVVSNAIGVPFSPVVADQVAAVPGVQTVARVRYANAEVDGSSAMLAAVDAAAFTRAMRLHVTAGDARHLRGQTLLLAAEAARQNGVSVGDVVRLSIAGQAAAYRVVGLYESTPAIGVSYLTSLEALTAAGVVPADNLAYVVRSPGADAAAVTAAIDALVADLPTVSLKDQEAFAAEQRGPIDQLLALIYALLGLAVVIAVLGIINTLALSVVERIREVGLLRAVGLSRRQLRRMIGLESVVIAVLGASLGVVLGVAFGIALQRSQAESGVEVLSVPFGQLLAFVALAGVVGVLAALWPARAAARVDVLRAITTT